MHSLPWEVKVTELVKTFPLLKETRVWLVQHLFAVYCEFLEASVFVVTVGPNYER